MAHQSFSHSLFRLFLPECLGPSERDSTSHVVMILRAIRKQSCPLLKGEVICIIFHSGFLPPQGSVLVLNNALNSIKLFLPGGFQAPGMKGSVPRVNGANEHIYDAFAYIAKMYCCLYFSKEKVSL